MLGRCLGRRATDALTSSKLNAPGTYRKAQTATAWLDTEGSRPGEMPLSNRNIRGRLLDGCERGGRRRSSGKNRQHMLIRQTRIHNLRRRGRAMTAGHYATCQDHNQKVFWLQPNFRRIHRISVGGNSLFLSPQWLRL